MTDCTNCYYHSFEFIDYDTKSKSNFCKFFNSFIKSNYTECCNNYEELQNVNLSNFISFVKSTFVNILLVDGEYRYITINENNIEIQYRDCTYTEFDIKESSVIWIKVNRHRNVFTIQLIKETNPINIQVLTIKPINN